VHRPTTSRTQLILVLLGALVFPIHSPSQSPGSAPPTAKSGSEAKPDFSQEPVVYESIHESMRYENDGSGTRELSSRVRVQSTAGLSIAGQLVFEYNALDEELEVKSVRVLKKDGSIVTAGPESVQDLSAPITQSAPMYTDARQKHITVPGISVGDEVEFDVLLKAKPTVTGQFWRIWTFTNQNIVVDEELDLNVPKERALKIKSPEGSEPTVSVEGDRRLYHWAASNLKTPPPIDLFKNFEFDVIKLLKGYRPPPARRVMFSTFESWNDVSKWYAELERGRRIPTAEIRAKAAEISRGQQTDEAKAEAIYYWVSQNIRYVSLSFGVGRYQPHAATEVLTNRYGDCKDKTTLLEALLEAEGMVAQPVLVNQLADVDGDMPNPMQFNHAIAFLNVGGKEFWLDTTLGVGPFGYLLPQTRNTEALVVGDTSSTALRKLPQDFPFAAEYRVAVEGTVDKQGTLDGTVELQTRDDLEVLIRLLSGQFSREQLTKSADTVLARTNRFLYGSAQYSQFKVLNSSEVSRPIAVQFHVNGKLIFVDPNSTRAQLTAALCSVAMEQMWQLQMLPRNTSKANSKGEQQASPADLKHPKIYSLSVNLTFPDLPNSEVPAAKEYRLAEQFAKFESRDSWEGATFHGFKLLDIHMPTSSAGQPDEFMTFAKKITEAMPPLVQPKIETKSAPAPAKSQPVAGKYLAEPAVEEQYARGTEEAKRKNWANAIEAFGSTTKADPKYPDAWRELGRAQMYARQYSEAEGSFRKYLELAPSDSRAYLNMGWVLFNERKFEEARDLLRKRLAVAPNDADALFRLGTVYLALKEPEQAVAVLERSVAQFPNYLNAQFSLARAYLESHQELQAQESFRKAIAIDNSDGTLNSAAYLFAEHSAFLDLAEQWSQRSIDVVEKELNNAILATLQSGTWALVARVSHYWDTMGWIKFREGKTDAAQKYVFAAWQISDELTVDFHLGRIYETQGRKEEATEMYLGALNAIPPNTPMREDAKEARKRLVDLLGSDGAVEERLEQSRRKKSLLRVVSIANPGAEQGIAQYSVMIDANSRVVDLAATVTDDPLTSFHEPSPTRHSQNCLASALSLARQALNLAPSLCYRLRQLPAWPLWISLAGLWNELRFILPGALNSQLLRACRCQRGE
jgi:tetratricopeptide (TPR) repeat protein